MANEGIDVEARASLQNLSIEGEIDGNELRYGPTKLYDYEKLFNKPQIEGVTLIGNKRLSDLGLKKATSSSDGLMSKSDKAKLDGISSSAGSNVVATASADGLMSKTDKAKLDGIGAGSNVKSVNGKTGAVTLSKTDVGLGNVDNTKDADKPISTAVQKALDGKAGNSIATSSSSGLMSAADKTKLDSINPSEIATNTENIKKNADKIAKLNSATAEYRLMINPETGHMALAHYTKEA